MKTTKITSLLAIATIVLAISFTACKKDKDTPGDDLKVANDNAKVQGDMDQALNEINDAFSKSSLALRTDGVASAQSWQGPCDAVVDTTLLDTDKQITFTFNGTSTCIANRVRSGVIVAKLIAGNRWKDVGAVLQIVFVDFKVSYLSSNIAFTYNGAKTITNVDGGLVRNLGQGTSTVVHKVRGNLSVTFDDGSERTWWVARRNTYDFNSGNIKFTSAGDSLMANPDSVLALIPIAVGGTNRFGNSFIYRAPVDIVSLAGCGWDKPVNGQRIYVYNNRTVTITFGVDAQGNASGGTCAYGFKVEWIRANGQIGTAVISY